MILIDVHCARILEETDEQYVNNDGGKSGCGAALERLNQVFILEHM